MGKVVQEGLSKDDNLPTSAHQFDPAPSSVRAGTHKNVHARLINSGR
jgi:hypothetical protein